MTTIVDRVYVCIEKDEWGFTTDLPMGSVTTLETITNTIGIWWYRNRYLTGNCSVQLDLEQVTD